jgi:hypothetical protein
VFKEDYNQVNFVHGNRLVETNCLWQSEIMVPRTRIIKANTFIIGNILEVASLEVFVWLGNSTMEILWKKFGSFIEVRLAWK